MKPSGHSNLVKFLSITLSDPLILTPLKHEVTCKSTLLNCNVATLLMFKETVQFYVYTAIKIFIITEKPIN